MSARDWCFDLCALCSGAFLGNSTCCAWQPHGVCRVLFSRHNRVPCQVRFQQKKAFHVSVCVCLRVSLCVCVCLCVYVCMQTVGCFFFCCLTVSLTALQFVFSLGALASAQEHVQGPFAAECVPLIVLGLVFVSVWKVLSPPPTQTHPAKC